MALEEIIRRQSFISHVKTKFTFFTYTLDALDKVILIFKLFNAFLDARVSFKSLVLSVGSQPETISSFMHGFTFWMLDHQKRKGKAEYWNVSGNVMRWGGVIP